MSKERKELQKIKSITVLTCNNTTPADVHKCDMEKASQETPSKSNLGRAYFIQK